MDSKQINNEKLNDVNGGALFKSICTADESCNTAFAATVAKCGLSLNAGVIAESPSRNGCAAVAAPAEAAASNAAKCGAVQPEWVIKG